MKCPKCWKEMINKWNIDNMIYSSYPAQRDNTRVCEECKVKTKKRETEQIIKQEDYSKYKEI